MSLVSVVPHAVWGIPVPFVNGVVHVYVVRGERVALIDSGVARISAPRIVAALENLGIVPADIDVVLNSHGHPDHIGGNADLRAVAGSSLEVLAHPDDAWLMRDPAEHLRHECDPASTLAELGERTAFAERSRFLHETVAPDTGPDRWVFDGDTVDLGGLTLRVIHTPGHTAGSACIHVPEIGVLFSGDAIERYGGDVGSPPMYRDATSYRASLDRLRDLGPHVVCMSHPYVGADGSGEPVLRGQMMARALDESIAAIDRFDRAVSTVDTGTEPELSLRSATAQVCSELGLDPASREQFARVAVTVRAHRG
ncbi:MBL fold metallo-hydrolase [Actinobacteria bacterium YIM 96077]|uniref:Metallo-beta-lactamase domain-containing protein n=1 Tax=Phytoactinopolyspora halophila TaxID=1981511 RepID=A0A329QC72_9ACTN|nr:MBL fold metallo-hydrolase [Phytoactinopolyspora halophila]AYY11826.1 MBL fold metallo-hydrolase [Actinobacteria bacterium YIM 96077]RAW09847.1 hypothetical protein DPM12_20090 [Phytoactinopolyspora halophila]